jgi:hypothetical protein
MPRSELLHWGKLSRRWIARQCSNDKLPDWQRIAFAAYSRVGFDGVAAFGRGELAEAASRVRSETGEVVPPSNPRKAVREAIAAGWIEPGSTTRRVIVHGDVYSVGKF